MAQKRSSRIHILRPDESPIGVSVRAYISGGDGQPPRLLDQRLEISEEGRVLGALENVSGFQLNLLVPKGSVVCQRDRERNKYLGLLPSSDRSEDPELEYRQMRVGVYWAKQFGLYTFWRDHEDPRSSNNAAIWEIQDDGHVTMWEVGIFSPNGRDFFITYDIRWDGQLYEAIFDWVVGIPSDPQYGPFSVRESILVYEPFMKALPALPGCTGDEPDMSLTLPEGPNEVVIDWWHVLMGMGRGQGIVLLHDGTSAWLRGQEVEGLDPDRPVYLERGQRLELLPQPNGKVVVNDMGKTPRVVKARLLP